MGKTLKKSLALFLALLLIMGTVPTSVFAVESEETTPEYSYTESTDGTIEITRYNGSDHFVSVPTEIDEKTVVAIGDSAFKGNNNLVEITIPNGIKYVRSRAFADCENLYSALISSSVDFIDTNTFEGSESVKLLCYFGSFGYDYAKENVFKYIRIYENDEIETSGDCGSKAKWHLNLITGLLSIYGSGAMSNYSSSNPAPWNQYASNLKLLKFYDDITTIGSYAFYNCTGLTRDLVIPASVTSIGNYAFYGCTGLDGKLTIEGNENGTSIGQYAFYNCSKFSSLELGEGVSSIGQWAFYNCYGMKGALVIPDSVTSIETYAFYNCSGFTSLKLSENLTAIPSSAFNNCTNLAGELVIPDKVTTINGYDAFENCSKITSVVFGEGITSVDNYAFSGCNNVKEITFKGTTPPSNGSFLGYMNSSLQTVYVPAESYSAYVTKFSSYVNGGRILMSDSNNEDDFIISKKTLLLYQGEGGEVVIPAGVEKIGQSAFQNCKAITSVTFNDDLTSIDSYAFDGCTNLESITFNNGLATIGSYAYWT